MKIIFAISALNAGGTQRVVSLMANYWAKNHDIIIITRYKSKPFYTIDKKIKIINLGYVFTSKENHNYIKSIHFSYKRIKKTRKIIKSIKPSLIISFITNMNIETIIASRNLKTPFIISDRNNPSYENINFLIKLIKKFTYNLANLLVVQTNEVKIEYRNYKVPLKVIRNPLKPIKFWNKQDNKIILAVGRMDFQKGFDLLINAFSKIDTEHKLIIIGEGIEQNNLEILIKKLNLKNKVFLPGKIKDIESYLSQATIFVLSSRTEGYPNALCEAMSFGLACISFNCKYGPSDIINNNVNGILVENGNINKLAEGIDYLIRNKKFRDSLGTNAKNLRNKLNIDIIMKTWEETIENLINGKIIN